MRRLGLTAVAVALAAGCGADSSHIAVFTAAPSSIELGDSTQLMFTVEQDSLVRIDNGIGDVTGRTSVTVSPTTTTTYTLIAVRPGKNPGTASTTVTVGPSPSRGFALTRSGTSNGTAGTPMAFALSALNAAGTVNPNFRGTVHFTSDDPRATLPEDVTFTAADAGTRTVNATFKTAGNRLLLANDTANGSAQGIARFAVDAGPASALVLSGVPSSAVAGDRLSFTVSAVDAFGNVAPGYSGTVHVSSSDGAALLPADFTFTAANAGSRTFAATLATAGTATVTVADPSGGVAAATSASIPVAHGSAAKVTLEGLASEVAIEASNAVTATIRDAFGNPVTNYSGTLHFVLSDSAAPAISDIAFTASMLGSATLAAQFFTDGQQSIVANDTANPSLTGAASTHVNHGAATAYVLSALPATAIAGTPMALVIKAVDRRGNLVTNYAGTAHVSSADATDELPPDGAFTGGVRTVSLAFVTAAVHSATVTEVGGTISATTTAVSVSNAAAARVTLQGLAAQVVVDDPAIVTVTVRDSFGNPTTNYAGTLHFALTDLDAPPLGDVTFNPAMLGTKDISVVFFTAGDQSVLATDTTNASLSGSTATRVNHAGAFTYSLSPLPSGSVAGEPLPLTVTAVDRHGNVVKNYAGTAHVSSTDPTDRLPADGGFTGGIRTVSLAFVSAGSHLATVSEVGGTITANTTSVDVVSGDAVQLLVSGASATAGAAASTTVTAKDTYSNTVGSYAGTIAFSSTDAQAVLPGGFTFATTDAGQHTFSVTLKTAGAQTVTASDAAHSLSGTGGFTVAPASGTNCSVTGLPASAAAGAQLGLRVTVKDDFGNVATGYSGTIGLTSSDGSAQLSAAATFAGTDAGSRAFSAQLRLAGPQTVTASDGASPFSCQGNVTIVPGATLFLVTFAGTDAWAGTPVVATVRAQDGFGNGVTNYAGTIAFATSDAAAATPANVTLNGTEGGTTNVNVTFNTVGLQTLTATDTVVSTATGTGTQTVHGLVYTDPSSGGKVRVVKNAASTASIVQLDVVSNTSLFAVTLGTNDSVRNGVFAAGMNLPLDTAKVGPDATFLVTTAPAGSSALLSLGTGTQAKAAAINNGVLYSGISQKRVDATAGAASNNMRGDVSVRPFPGASSFYYSLRLKLTPGAAAGTVFDGQNLGAKFHAAVRDRSGSDVFQNADFAVGKLEVR